MILNRLRKVRFVEIKFSARTKRRIPSVDLIKQNVKNHRFMFDRLNAIKNKVNKRLGESGCFAYGYR
jgi:hypothetical protein